MALKWTGVILSLKELWYHALCRQIHETACHQIKGTKFSLKYKVGTDLSNNEGGKHNKGRLL